MKANRALREGEPDYNLAEELISAISHGLGALFGVAALVLGLLAAADDGAAAVVGAAVYGGSMVLLYTCSTIYHSLRVNMAKRVFRILDHCGVFLLIAGTYTPLLLVSMYSQSPTTAVVMLVLLFLMFRSRQVAEGTDTKETAAEVYVPGVYSATVALHDLSFDVQVRVDTDRNTSVELVNMNETVQTMYPLVETSMDELRKQILDTQTTRGLTCRTQNRYTAALLVHAIDTALEKAKR